MYWYHSQKNIYPRFSKIAVETEILTCGELRVRHLKFPSQFDIHVSANITNAIKVFL